MLVYRLLVLIIATAVCGLAQSRYYLPQVIDGTAKKAPAGSSPVKVTTTFVLVNSGKTPANVTITSTRDDSTGRSLTIPTLGSGASFSAILPPGASRLYVSDGSGDGTAGAAAVISDVPISVSEILSSSAKSGDPVSESAIPAVAAEDLGSEFMIPVDTTSGLNGGAALFNPGTASASLTLRLLDKDGKQQHTANVTLAAQGRTTILAAGAPLSASNFKGTLDIVSSSPIAATSVRQHASSQAFTLFPATRQLGGKLQVFLPGLVDGRNSSSITYTTFLLTNLGTQTAVLNMTLAQANGSPFLVTFPGLIAASVYKSLIPPGASFFWQTLAEQSPTSGAATIQSDQPLAVTAAVTTIDPKGNFVSETSAAAAPVNFQFAIPFDNSTGANAGASFFNTGTSATNVTLFLADPDGKQLATKKLASLAAGAGVTGTVSDFFPGVSATQGSITAFTSTPLDMFLSAVSLRQSGSGVLLSSSAAAVIPWSPSGTPSTVVPTLDMTNQVSNDIPRTGGSLSVSDAKGNHFTLTIPSGALLTTTTITMTAISSATGVSGPGLVAGVQLEPDGLALFQPAQLKIELAHAAPSNTFPIGWRGQTPGIFLNSPLPDPKSFTVTLDHFSGAGLGGFDLTTDLLRIYNLVDLFRTALSYYVLKAKAEAELGDGETSTPEQLEDEAIARDIFERGYEQLAEPLAQLALDTGDPDVMRCAVVIILSYARQQQLLGSVDEDSQKFIETVHRRFAELQDQLSAKAFNILAQRCQQHDFTVITELLAIVRIRQLLGFNTDDFSLDDAKSCPPAVELDYSSEFGVALGGFSFDTTLNGKIKLIGTFDKSVLDKVNDPATDLYTDFKLSGQAVEQYSDLSVKAPPSDCSTSFKSTTPDVMAVEEGTDPQVSRIKFKFIPQYVPEALTYKGQQLCSVCPVYRKTPIQVDLVMNPGAPSEQLEQDCPGLDPNMLQFFAWLTGWSAFHAPDTGYGVISDWSLVNQPDLFAQKPFSQSMTVGGLTFSENSDFKLKPCGASSSVCFQ